MTTIRARWINGTFKPLGRVDLPCDEGEAVYLTVERERSGPSHRHEFAWLRDAWESLPESLAGEPYAASPEHLRKYALIQRGYCTVREIVVADTDDAARVRAFMRPLVDDYAVIAAAGPVVRVYTAESQSRKAMGRDRFHASKTAIMDWVAELLGVTAADLSAPAADFPLV
jgi:hypothetical protein